MPLNDFIKSLQAKPYRQRMRILWLVSAAIAVVLLSVWAGLIRVQNPGFSDQTGNPFGYFTDLFDKAKAQITQFKDSGSAPTPEAELTLKNFSISSVNKTLTVNFSVKNSGTDILNFSGSDLTNITLTDGAKTLTLQKITQPGGVVFPKRILASTEVSGQMVFPLPQEKIVTISISSLSYLETPDKTFNKTLTLDLNSPDVQNLLQGQSPRD
ncbi:MAG: hypothetical protein M1275_00630 [Patescibacteria group bacterium]|nr:hypothetical protein [Patescibacteria group bacterium]